MTQRDWQQEPGRTLGVFLNGDEIPSRTAHGEEIVDDSFLLLFNAHFDPVTFTLPTRRFGAAGRSRSRPATARRTVSWARGAEVVVQAELADAACGGTGERGSARRLLSRGRKGGGAGHMEEPVEGG